MTPERLRECLKTLDWTQRGLARLLGRPEGTVRQWLAGVVRVPADVAEWLEALARFHERHPPPVR
jgi:transcriptional regulator with XRE-family HTH domain